MNGQTPRSAAAHRRKVLAELDAQILAAKERRTHYVYRCYDKAGQLLYIGCTEDVEARMQVHRSSWHNPASAYLSLHMDRYEVEEIVGRTAARKAERAAIKAEAPLLNVHHNDGRGLPRVKVSDMPPISSEQWAAIGALFQPTGEAS